MHQWDTNVVNVRYVESNAPQRSRRISGYMGELRVEGADI